MSATRSSTIDTNNDQIAQVTIPYRPRWFQAKVHKALKRFSVLVFHRRAGKTVLAINELIKRIITCPMPDAQGHYVAPYYSQVKRIAWKYLVNFTRDIPGMEYNKSELLATFPNRATIQLLGGDNYHAHRGIYSDYVVLDEYAQMHPALWGEVFRPALSDRKGGGLFIGTPQGHNQFYKTYQKAGRLEDWYRAIYDVTQTGALDRDEIIAASREISPEEFQQEYMCSWTAAIRGAYYGKIMEAMDKAGRITEVNHDPSLPVITSWDLGMRDSTVIHYWQLADREVRMIDCDAYQGTGLPQMILDLQKKPYQYTQHIAPHDINVRELGTGKSRFDIAASLGLHFSLAPSLSLQDGIQATRIILPRCVMDSRKCQDSIEALRQYRTEYDDKRQIFRDTPLHNWCSDYVDSVRYFAITDHITQVSTWQAPLNYDQQVKTVI